MTLTKPINRDRKTSPNSLKRNTKKPQARLKRRIFHFTLCLSALALSFSTAGVTLAFVDLGPGRRIVDLIDRTTDNQDIENISQTIGTIDQYLSQAQEFYRNISRKNVSGVIQQLELILGELGILSPRGFPQTIDDLYGTPTFPGEIYAKQQIVTDTANSNQLWTYLDSVLGNGEQEGQTRLHQMDETNVASTEVSVQGQEGSATISEQAFQNAEVADAASQATEQLAQQAQGYQVSQDVLKSIASQQAELAKSNSAMANQLATLSDQQAIAATQAAALATQSQLANEHLRELQVGQSIGNVQLHDIFNAQRHANQMEIAERQKNSQFSVGSTDAIYLPGLFSEQTSN